MRKGLDKNWLYEQYITIDKTPKQISVENNISYSTVIHRIYDLEMKKDKQEKSYNSKEWLYEQYILNGKTAKQIANEIGCSRDQIAHKLSEFNIARGHEEYLCDNRDWLYEQYIVQDKTYKQIAEEFNIPDGIVATRGKKFGFKKDKPVFTKEFLYEEHIVKHKNMLQIAHETGHNNTTVRKYMDMYKIPVWTCKDSPNEYWDNKDGTTSVAVFDNYGKYLDSFIVDTDKVDKIQGIKWLLVRDTIVKDRERYRVISNTHPSIILARFLLDVNDDNLFVDHKDNNPLNNRIENLRIATRSDNQSNHDIHCNNTSGFTGVSFDNKAGKWFAQIKAQGIHYYFGKYLLLEDAVYARYCAEKILFGEFRSDRNDDNILSAIDKCCRKDEIKQYVTDIINKRKLA